jgi:hypothetical protein
LILFPFTSPLSWSRYSGYVLLLAGLEYGRALDFTSLSLLSLYVVLISSRHVYALRDGAVSDVYTLLALFLSFIHSLGLVICISCYLLRYHATSFLFLLHHLVEKGCRLWIRMVRQDRDSNSMVSVWEWFMSLNSQEHIQVSVNA